MFIDSKLLKNNIKDFKFIVWDTETEGLSDIHSRPWEIAWDIYHGTELVESNQFYLKWPNLNVSPGAARATGFNQETINKYGHDPKKIIDLFDKDLYNKEYNSVTHNGLGFDIYIHNTARLELGYDSDYSYLTRFYDTDAISRGYKTGAKVPEDKSEFLAWQYRMSSIIRKGMKTSNSTMAKEFGIEVDEAKLHGARYDISIGFPIFLNLIKKLDIQ